MQNCNECLRLKVLLQESGLDYLAATNRYNTLLLTGLDKSWAREALRTAKIANDERQRQYDEHVEKHEAGTAPAEVRARVRSQHVVELSDGGSQIKI